MDGEGFDDAGDERGAVGRVGESLLELGDEFGGLLAVEVADGAFLLLLVGGGQVLSVEDERQDSVEEAGARVGGGDVLELRKAVLAEADGLIGGDEEELGEACERLLGGEGVEGVVAAGGLAVVVDGFEERAEGGEFGGGPGELAGLLAEAVLEEGAFGSGEVVLLLVVIEELGGGF